MPGGCSEKRNLIVPPASHVYTIRMSPGQLLRETVNYAREYGARKTIARARSFAREASLRQWHAVSGRSARGEHIFEKEWDLLIVLDACRVDAIGEVAGEYEFLDSPGTFESAASYSLAWMEENFASEYADEMSETVMVTGNPFSRTALDSSSFDCLDEVWQYTWDDEVGTIPPRPITDRAITQGREKEPDRMIVHYMQPHEPFTTHPELQACRTPDEWADATERSIWEQVAAGEVPSTEAEQAYMDELRMVLDEVGVLLRNVDAETAVITADHGEAFGETGVYGHPRGVAIDALRTVPWYVTSGRDTGEHEPEHRSLSDESVQDQRLRDLGYL